MRMQGMLVAALMGMLGGYVGALVAQPTGDDVIPNPVMITDTSVHALDVSGGAEFGSGDVELIGIDGKINGPLSSTILDDLSGVNLTSLNASNLGSGTAPTARLGSGTASASTYLRGNQTWGALNAAHLTTGTMPVARLPDNTIVDTAFDTDATQTSSATTTWVDTGLSLTITVNDATNDVVLMAWQHVSASGGNAGCQLRFVRGTTALTTLVTGAGPDHFKALHIEEDTNPGTGAHTYKTQLNRTGTVNTCFTEHGAKQSVLWAYEVQD